MTARAPKMMARSRFTPARLLEGVPVEILRFIPIPDHRPASPAIGEPTPCPSKRGVGSLSEWLA